MINEPRGVRNNNPGNIRHSNTHWQGQCLEQTDDAFVQFNEPVYGIRAIARIMKTYYANGFDTVQEIISRWAPATDHNNTNAYIANVCHALGVKPDEKLELVVHLPALVAAIIEQENGEQPYSPQTIVQGLALA
jgi:hypothetical protein